MESECYLRIYRRLGWITDGFWYMFMVHRLSWEEMIAFGTWFVLLPFEKLSKCPFQELCKIPSQCFGAWRITSENKLSIFVLYSK